MSQSSQLALSPVQLLPALLPPVVRTSERRDDGEPVDVYPEEQAYVADAVESRRREFATVRLCARDALAQLGGPTVAIPPAADRSPRWPPGFVGSMTHCEGFRGAAVARDADILGVGIDAEPDSPLPAELHAMVASPQELAALRALRLTGHLLNWERLLFSCKESVFKAWYPLTRRWLNFDDAEVSIDLARHTFTAQLRVWGPEMAGKQLGELYGAWTARDGLLITATVIPVADGPVPGQA